MTDNLRDRIAAAIKATLIEGGGYSGANEKAFGEPLVYIDGAVFPAELADAVIEALKPQVDVIALAAWLDRPTTKFRYVTEWQYAKVPTEDWELNRIPPKPDAPLDNIM